jgi:membrane protein YdbS with pleckstrin-like domain
MFFHKESSFKTSEKMSITYNIVAIFIIVAILALGVYPDIFKLQFGLINYKIDIQSAVQKWLRFFVAEIRNSSILGTLSITIFFLVISTSSANKKRISHYHRG